MSNEESKILGEKDPVTLTNIEWDEIKSEVLDNLKKQKDVFKNTVENCIKVTELDLEIIDKIKYSHDNIINKISSILVLFFLSGKDISKFENDIFVDDFSINLEDYNRGKGVGIILKYKKKNIEIADFILEYGLADSEIEISHRLVKEEIRSVGVGKIFFKAFINLQSVLKKRGVDIYFFAEAGQSSMLHTFLKYFDMKPVETTDIKNIIAISEEKLGGNKLSKVDGVGNNTEGYFSTEEGLEITMGNFREKTIRVLLSQ